MEFHSFEYFLFLPAVAALYFSIPHRFRWVVLLAASYIFYASWRVDFLWLLVVSTLTDYVAGLRIETATTERARKVILGISLFVNLGLLFTFKYTPAIWDLAGHVAKGAFAAPADSFAPIDVLLPLGISFYTFQTLSYTIDVYRRRIPAERHLGYFALYVAFFPQLLAGPIERAGHLLKEIRIPQRFEWSRCETAFFLIVLGLAKKLVIADRLATLLAPIVTDPLSHSPLEVLLTPPATVYQFYCDLSGYADIALGSALLIGIRLSRNFDRPFAVTSTMRFWYRWHITVTAWFRDYLLRPLTAGGSVTAARPVALIVTGLVIGLWHAPTLGWVIAGGSVGLLSLAEGAWTRWRVRNDVQPRSRWARWLWGWGGRLYVWAVVFYLIGLPLTWGELETLGAVLAHAATVTPADLALWPAATSLSPARVATVGVAIVALEIWQWLDAHGHVDRLVRSVALEVRWFLAGSGAVGVLMLAELNQSGFLYFRF